MCNFKQQKQVIVIRNTFVNMNIKCEFSNKTLEFYHNSFQNLLNLIISPSLISIRYVLLSLQ